MKYFIIFFLLFCCGTVFADSKEAIQLRSVWINSQYEDGKITEEAALAEIQDLKRRAIALDEPVTYQSSPIETQKIVEIAGTSLLRQATVPGPAGWSVFRFIGGIGWVNIFLWIFLGGFVAIVLFVISEIFKRSAQAAEAEQQRRVQANIPVANNHRDNGPSLASVIGTIPVRPMPQGYGLLRNLHVCDDREPEETLIARGYSWNNPSDHAILSDARRYDRERAHLRENSNSSPLHSGEVPDHLV